jgi:hypothetical protein
MKRQWHLRRTAVMTPEGRQRWDTAYQTILAWGYASPQPVPPHPMPTRHLAHSVQEEEEHARSHLCPRFDAQPSAHPDH